ncbi:MAG: GTP cyclohydrolase IIa, partial [Halohasta sp.]
IAHFDVNDATGKYTDQLNEFDSFIHIERSYASLMEYMRKAHGGLSFFVGGDNIIAVCPQLTPEAYQDALDHVKREVGVDLKVGVGSGATAHEAGIAAKHALEDCRYEGTTVEFAGSPVPASDD